MSTLQNQFPRLRRMLVGTIVTLVFKYEVITQGAVLGVAFHF